jgi:DNA repair exonuclease SbcCD ATPase subunit
MAENLQALVNQLSGAASKAIDFMNDPQLDDYGKVSHMRTLFTGLPNFQAALDAAVAERQQLEADYANATTANTQAQAALDTAAKSLDSANQQLAAQSKAHADAIATMQADFQGQLDEAAQSAKAQLDAVTAERDAAKASLAKIEGTAEWKAAKVKELLAQRAGFAGKLSTIDQQLAALQGGNQPPVDPIGPVDPPVIVPAVGP